MYKIERYVIVANLFCNLKIMRTFFSIEKGGVLGTNENDNSRRVDEICSTLNTAIRGAARIERFGSGDINHLAFGVMASEVIPVDKIRVAVVKCGFTFVEGSYTHDPEY